MSQDISDSNDMTHIRQMTGVCPQQNVLINELTVTEHLVLFAGLKGVPDSLTAEYVSFPLLTGV